MAPVAMAAVEPEPRAPRPCSNSTVLLPALGAAVAVALAFGPLLRRPPPGPEFTETPVKSYDFIVVGGGTAGSLVAAQLARTNPGWSILLLEAGGATRDGAATAQTVPSPAVDKYVADGEAIDWGYRAEPQRAALTRDLPSAYRDRRYPIPRGKGLGGSAELNLMLHVRGTPEDYDGWAAATGEARWGYAAMSALEDAYESLVGGVAGSKVHPLADAWVESAGQAGLKTTESYNDFSLSALGSEHEAHKESDGSQPTKLKREGGFHYQHSVRGKQRLSTARQVLLPLLTPSVGGSDADDNTTAEIKRRKSLSVILHAHVLELLWAAPSLVLGEEDSWIKPRRVRGVRVQLRREGAREEVRTLH